MICHHCGRTLTPLEKFCPGCKTPAGAKRTDSRNIGQITLDETNNYRAFSPKSDTQANATKTTVYVLLGIVLVVALLSVVAWVLSTAQ
jgi:predicted amidophosphoribosyltransferase